MHLASIRGGYSAAILLLTIFLAGCSSKNGALTSTDGTFIGHWEGRIALESGALRVFLHIERDSSGNPRALMDSPDQLAFQIPVTGITLTEDSIDLNIFPIAARYVGRLASVDRIDGQWMQGNSAHQVTFKRNDDIAFVRPQQPKAPFPYTQEDFAITLRDKGTLAGTLTLPQGNGPYPVAIMISGSGVQDRDETIAGHKPFFVLADQLARNGIATLRYDDRGAGSSKANPNVSANDVAMDVLEIYTKLKSDARIDPKRIGLIGHSEGGFVAGIAAREEAEIAFAVLLASPALPGDSILALQYDKLVDTTYPPYLRTVQRRSLSLIKSIEDSARLRHELQAMYESAYDSIGATLKSQFKTPKAYANANVMQLMNKALLFLVRYDPRVDLAQLQIPILAMYGSKDLQVPAEQNVPAMELALRGKRNVMIEVMPELNHLFQTSTTGKLDEYGTIRETIAPIALDRIISWIRNAVTQ
ncbi:MAG TPA: alpha/beta hydrolase [Candidatus Kapabacteria bacterium]|nr:alpha/beta hydrolase [Candidatus Kapabacteria bacterium]